MAAIAIETDSAQKAKQRAEALGATPFVSPVGAGELIIPAVRGVAGSLLFFLDPPRPGATFHEIDFVPDPDPSGAPDIGLTKVDHLAQVVPPAELASWVLFYRALLGLEPEHRTDLVDPRGPIVSRALKSTDGAVRIVLNSSPSQTSGAGRFLARTAGAGAQHVAIACRDLLAAARQIPNELKLPIPENYYADLEARFGLEPAFIEDLRSAGVLYDRIGHGEFLHLYTRSMNGFSSNCSSVGAATTGMAKPTHRCAWPRRPNSTAARQKSSPECAGVNKRFSALGVNAANHRSPTGSRVSLRPKKLHAQARFGHERCARSCARRPIGERRKRSVARGCSAKASSAIVAHLS